MVDAPPALTPDQQAQLTIEAQFANPVILPIRFGVDSVTLPDGQPAILVSTQTPAGSQRLVMTRDNALEFARAIKKQAETGPQLVTPPTGLVVAR